MIQNIIIVFLFLQVWNWFQNRRYAQRARSSRPPAKLSISPLPRDDSISSRHVIHPASVPAGSFTVSMLYCNLLLNFMEPCASNEERCYFS